MMSAVCFLFDLEHASKRLVRQCFDGIEDNFPVSSDGRAQDS